MFREAGYDDYEHFIGSSALGRFLGPEGTRELVSNLNTADLLDREECLQSFEVSNELSLIMPGLQQRRIFLGEGYSMQVIERLAVYKEMGEVDRWVNDLRPLGFDAKGWIARGFLAYMVIKENEKMWNYFGGAKGLVIAHIKQSQLSGMPGIELLWHPEIDRVLDLKLEPSELLAGKWGRSDLRWWLEEETMEMGEDLSSSNFSWESRLRSFGNLLKLWNYGAPEDALINSVLGKSYWDGLSSEKRRKLVGMKFVDQQKIISGLRNKMGHRDMLELRGQIGGEQITDRIVDMAREKRIDFIEDWRHPLNHLHITLGYEIEHAEPAGLTREHFYMVETAGFRLGGGGGQLMESSPGPFRRSETAELVFLDWVGTGIVDLYKQFGQTLHLNLGLSVREGLPFFVRSLQATMWAYNPKFVDNNIVPTTFYGIGGMPQVTNRHSLKMGTKNHGHGDYLESKEFSVQTVSGTLRLFRYSSLLGAALNQWQKQRSGSRRYTQDEVSLADIWREYEQAMKSGFAQANLKLTEEAPEMKEAVKFADMLKSIVPDRWSRYENSDKVSLGSISFEDKDYPNIVSFSRAMAIKFSGRVDEVMKNAESDFITQLLNVVEEGISEATLEVLFERFPCGTTGKDYDIKLKRFEWLREMYGV